MKKEIVVISLGGSLIIPEEINTNVLNNFKKVILSNSGKYKFVVVCGGGSLARKYINSLKKIKINEHLQSLAGISATRTNARFMSYFFNQNPEKGISHKLRHIKKYLKKQEIVFCGALEYKPHQTSDSTAADIAKEFNSIFINLTNINGLYTDNPLTNKNAKFIPKISWTEFNKIANKLKFKPGQHFVLDQRASKIILENKIKTYILGKNMNNLNKLLKGKKFTGTTIEN